MTKLEIAFNLKHSLALVFDWEEVSENPMGVIRMRRSLSSGEQEYKYLVPDLPHCMGFCTVQEMVPDYSTNKQALLDIMADLAANSPGLFDGVFDEAKKEIPVYVAATSSSSMGDKEEKYGATALVCKAAFMRMGGIWNPAWDTIYPYNRL